MMLHRRTLVVVGHAQQNEMTVALSNMLIVMKSVDIEHTFILALKKLVRHLPEWKQAKTQSAMVGCDDTSS